VPDCELLYRSIAGPDARDRLSLAFGDQLPQRDATLPRLRIRHVTGIPGAPLDREIASAVKGAAAVLQGLGHKVEEGAAPYDLAQIESIWSTLTAAGLARALATHGDWRDKVLPSSVAIAERGAAIPAAQYVETIEAVIQFRRSIPQAFEAC